MYYNRYYDGLVNTDVPSFPVVSNSMPGCWQGRYQPFSAQKLGSFLAQNWFDVLVTRAGVLRLPIGPNVFVNFTLSCQNARFPAFGYDEQGPNGVLRAP